MAEMVKDDNIGFKSCARMKILVLGATGRTGRLVLRHALEAGHEVVCLARDPDRIMKNENCRALEGNPSDTVALKAALAGCNAVISVLNVSRTSDFPWAPLRTPKTLMSDTMHNLIALCKNEGPKRVVACSAWGVGETRKDIPFWFRWLIDHSNIGLAYKDHGRQELLLEESGLDWTIVRPVGLTNTRKKQAVRESFNNSPKPKLTISRNTLAKYMVDCVGNIDTLLEKIVVSAG